MFRQIITAVKSLILTPRSFRQFSTGESILSSVQEENKLAHQLPNSADIQDFKKEGWIFVDKTMEIFKILTLGGSHVLVRPRRFGKSFFISIAEAIIMKSDFLAGCEVWSHLNNNNTGNPIIRLDFSEIIRDQMSLQEYLQFQIFQHSQNLPNFPKFNNIIFSFVELLTEYSKIGKRPYIFIDEYDAPFWMEPYSQDTIEEFKNFFKVLKANKRFTEQVILVGCTTVRIAELFSGANHFNDLSQAHFTSKVFGFTDSEIRRYYANHIDYLGRVNGWDFEETMAELKKNYNGYKFHPDAELIYNPISIIKTFLPEQL